MFVAAKFSQDFQSQGLKPRESGNAIVVAEAATHKGTIHKSVIHKGAAMVAEWRRVSQRI